MGAIHMQKDYIQQLNGHCCLGIELGSTRIKAVLIDAQGQVVATGNYSWQNSLMGNIWTYPLEQVHGGLQAAYADLKQNVQQQYGVTLKKLRAVGVSAMMHGYLAFDRAGGQLAEFRTWRNTLTSQAAEQLSNLFQYNIPQRWSCAHLYQAILNGEPHIASVDHITTLAGYVHWQLTGQKQLGIGDASGMFPIDLTAKDWNKQMLEQFDGLHTQTWKLKDLLPKVLLAGQEAAHLTEAGVALLDKEGDLQAGILCCPPEGDAGTGMVATNSVAVRTGNVSAGTSVFAMLVLEKALSKMYREIDLVTTPDGLLVAMVHCNNGCSDIDAWIGLLGEAAALLQPDSTQSIDSNRLFNELYRIALKGAPDCGELLHYGYVAGEDLLALPDGYPLFVRQPGSALTLANFMRSQLYSSLCALRVGLDILRCDEGVQIDELRGHGGFFKTEGVGQQMMAAATNIPLTVLQNAGEGGAWGIALLAMYTAEIKEKATESTNKVADAYSLSGFLNRIFVDDAEIPMQPHPQDVAGFNQYLARFMAGLKIQRSAAQNTQEPQMSQIS